MGKRAGFRLTWLACGAILVLIAGAVGLAVLNPSGIEGTAFLIAEASAALVGGLIASRRPRNPVGWFVLGHALCFSLGEFGRQYAIYGVLTEPGSLPAARAMIWPTYWIWYPGLFLMFVLLPLYFPDGRLVSRRWRWVVGSATLFFSLATVFGMFRPGDDEASGIPNPLGIEAFAEGGRVLPLLAALVPIVLLVFSAAAAASLVVRFRRSSGEGRQQIKWAVFAAVFLFLNTALARLFFDYISPLAEELLFLAALESMWLAIAVAILRHRLYDIDVLINRTLVYAALTVALALVYLGSVVGLQYVFRGLTGEGSTLAVVASTLLIAALFNPLRRRVQGFIDRRFYRKKYDAGRVLADFSATLRDGTDLGRLDEDLISTIRQTVQPEHASLWLRPRDTSEAGP